MDGRKVAEEIAVVLHDTLGEHCRAVALFGSWARNRARDDSDIDLLLIADDLADDPFRRAVQTRAPFARRLEPVSILARTPAEFEVDISPLHLDLAIDAIVLFESDRYLSRLLAVTRQRIKEAGLFRDEKLFWHWHEPPKVANWAIHWDGVRL